MEGFLLLAGKIGMGIGWFKENTSPGMLRAFDALPRR